MGGISIIARRLENGYVQYGWSGNGGNCKTLGARLLEWYCSPDLVEYLFGLGEAAWIGVPHSEHGGYGFMNTHCLTGNSHTLGKSEREIFSKIAYIDYGYFYDLDNKWYYVVPGPFRIKYPLELVANNLNQDFYEFDFLRESAYKLIKYIFHEYLSNDKELQELIHTHNYNLDMILNELLSEQFPLRKLFDNYRSIYAYFDDWVVIESDHSYSNITGFKIRKKEVEHIETNEW